MRYLHRGHPVLVEEAKTRASRMVVSIYINPVQFAVGEDFSTYPSNFEGDLDKLKDLGVDAVFIPSDLYVTEDNARAGKGQDSIASGFISCLEDKSGNGHEIWIRVEKMERPLCGKSRPIFFRGVAKVVAKLFNIVEPDFAVFEKKDYQQWRLICGMGHSVDIVFSGSPPAYYTRSSTVEINIGDFTTTPASSGGLQSFMEMMQAAETPLDVHRTMEHGVTFAIHSSMALTGHDITTTYSCY